MNTTENLWKTLWNSVEPIPPSLQVPLFDYKTQAEKVL